MSCWLPAILGLIWSAPELSEKWEIVADNIWALLYLGVVAIADRDRHGNRCSTMGFGQ